LTKEEQYSTYVLISCKVQLKVVKHENQW